jgi:hypothetical protein
MLVRRADRLIATKHGPPDLHPLLLDAASRISEQLGAALSLDGRRRTPEPRRTV